MNYKIKSEAQSRHEFGKELNLAVLKTASFLRKPKYKSEKINTTLLFEASGIPVVAYSLKQSYILLGTVYHLYLGTFSKAGILIDKVKKNKILGFEINYPEIWRTIQAISSKKQNNLHNFFKRQKTGLMWGQSSNLGHHIWNEQSGLEHLISTRYIKRIQKVLIGKWDFFQTSTFFKDCKIKTENKTIDWLKGETWKGALLKTTELKFLKKAKTRLIRKIYENPLDKSAAAVLQIINKHKAFWVFQIRLHERCWLSEKKGLETVIKWILKKDAGICVGIDGFGAIDGMNPSGDPVFLKEQQFIEEMIKKSPEKIVALAGLPFLSKALLLKRANIVIGPIGSGGVLCNWLLDRPLIVYGPPSYYKWTRIDSRKVPEEKPPKALYVPAKFIQSKSNRNYEFNVKHLINSIKNCSVLKND